MLYIVYIYSIYIFSIYSIYRIYSIHIVTSSAGNSVISVTSVSQSSVISMGSLCSVWQARSWLSISGGGALQKECNRGVGMILTFVLAASFPFQLRKIGIERNVLLHFKSIILVLNFVSL